MTGIANKPLKPAPEQRIAATKKPGAPFNGNIQDKEHLVGRHIQLFSGSLHHPEIVSLSPVRLIFLSPVLTLAETNRDKTTIYASRYPTSTPHFTPFTVY